VPTKTIGSSVRVFCGDRRVDPSYPMMPPWRECLIMAVSKATGEAQLIEDDDGRGFADATRPTGPRRIFSPPFGVILSLTAAGCTGNVGYSTTPELPNELSHYVIVEVKLEVGQMLNAVEVYRAPLHVVVEGYPPPMLRTGSEAPTHCSVRALIGRTYDLDCELAALGPLIAADWVSRLQFYKPGRVRWK
jgi:hypothetical protein